MILEELKAKIAAGLGLAKADFSYPPKMEMGDLSLACFEVAKTRSQSPVDTARELCRVALGHNELKLYFSRIEASGPYLNFFVDHKFLASRVLAEVAGQGRKYGYNEVGSGKRVMIEYSNGNTHKEYHIGHLRNISFGDAVTRLLLAGGYKAVPVSYINDFGGHVAKTIWFWRLNKKYQDQSGPKGYLLGQCYAEASRSLAADPSQKEAVSLVMKQIENRRGDNYRAWRETRRWSLRYLDKIYRELGIRFKDTFYESEVIDEGLRIVNDFKERGLLKSSQGAVIADLEEYGLGVLPIIRSDGTTLYPVGDLALAGLKFDKYNLDESIYVVDVRQSLYLKQLFKLLALSGDARPRRQLSYDFVTLPEGMMASRTGNVITYQYLKDQVFAKIVEETGVRHKDWSRAKVAKVAKILTVATIKFEMLKVSPEKTITFNVAEALRFDGYTACYLEYGYARLSSIRRKQGLRFRFKRPDLSLLTEQKERGLLLKIAKYPKAVQLARQNYNPSEISKYLFELVQASNDYYHETNILKAEPALRSARLALVKSIIQVLHNGFSLLGIEPLKEM